MIKALLLIFEPVATWERIFRTQRGVWFILLLFLVPLLVLTSGVEAYGLVHWGKYFGEVRRLRTFPMTEAVAFEIAQGAIFVLIVFGGAVVLKSMCDTFHGRHNYTQAFATVAYGLSPLLLLHLLDVFPSISPWVAWAIGIILSVGVLYQGVPRMMEPDPPHAFGLYLMSALMLLLATGLLRFVTAWYLQGKFERLQALIPH